MAFELNKIDNIDKITVITRRVVSIDFYRLIGTIDNVYVIDIDSYRFEIMKYMKFIYLKFIYFIFIFPGYITNQFNDQLPVGLLAQLIRALHRYRRGQGSNPGKPEFFQAFFSQLHKLR